MAQVNSGIATKACTYEFSKNTALGNGIYSWSGIEMKPGEAILKIQGTRFQNMASNDGGAVQFYFGWGPNANPSGAFTPLWTAGLSQMNTMGWALWPAPTTAFDGAYAPRLPSTVNTSISLWFSSSSALTSGCFGFVVTYLYAKF